MKPSKNRQNWLIGLIVIIFCFFKAVQRFFDTSSFGISDDVWYQGKKYILVKDKENKFLWSEPTIERNGECIKVQATELKKALTFGTFQATFHRIKSNNSFIYYHRLSNQFGKIKWMEGIISFVSFICALFTVISLYYGQRQQAIIYLMLFVSLRVSQVLDYLMEVKEDNKTIRILIDKAINKDSTNTTVGHPSDVKFYMDMDASMMKKWDDLLKKNKHPK